MRKYLVLSFLFLLPISSTAQENNYFLMLKNKKVNVRYGPSLDHPVKYIYRKIDLPVKVIDCLLYTSPSPRDDQTSRMPSSA